VGTLVIEHSTMVTNGNLKQIPMFEWSF